MFILHPWPAGHGHLCVCVELSLVGGCLAGSYVSQVSLHLGGNRPLILAERMCEKVVAAPHQGSAWYLPQFSVFSPRLSEDSDIPWTARPQLEEAQALESSCGKANV